MMRAITLILSAALFALAGSPCLAANSVPLVRIEGPFLSIEAQNQPLTAILDEFIRAGIRVRIDPRINPRVTASFENRSVGSGLESILRSFDYALVWAQKDGPGAEEPGLREIQIFNKGQTGAGLPLYKTSNLELEKDPAGVSYVKDTLLVRFDPALGLSERKALLKAIAATLVEEPAPLGIARLQLAEGSNVLAIADLLARIPGIQHVEPDYAYPLAGSVPVAGNFSSTAAETSPTAGSTTVAVLDSGLAVDYADSGFVAGAYDAVTSRTLLTGDPLGHGTQMTLIATGTVIPFGAKPESGEATPVVAIRAFDDNGFTSNYTLLRSIDYALGSGVKVLSMSWGTEQNSPFMEAAMAYASERGMIVVAAAGNSPSGKAVYPAAYDTVIGVGALMPDGSRWSQSNYGSFVSVYGPGLADLPVGSGGVPGIYAGTSIATAYTARRVAAILDSNPEADISEVLRQLMKGK